MADQTFQIGTGETYTTIQGWENASDVSTGFWKGELKDTAAYGAVTISGVTGVPTASNYVWLTATSGNEHSGVAGTSHARIEGDPPSALVVVDVNYTRVENIEIKLTGNGSSDECIRIASNTTNVLLSRLIIHSTGTGASQDGIYTGNWACSGSIDNCIIYGFDRAGIHLQDYNGTADQTWNIDYLTLFNNGGGAANEGNLSVDAGDSGAVVTVNVYNTASGDGGNKDFNHQSGSGTVTWTGTHNACSDTTLTSIGLTTSAQESLTVTATTQSSGSYMVFNNITGGSEDLLMLDEAAGNLLSDNATDRVGSEPDARQDFSLDIVGNTRSGSTPDIGASEILSAGTTVTATTDALIITENSAGVNAETNTNATTDVLALTENAATVSLGVGVNASTDALTLTEQAASVNAEVNANATTDALVITENAATVTLVVSGITATTDALTLTENVATVNAATNVTTTTDTLTVTTYAATAGLVLGVTIDGVSSKVLSTDYESVTLYFNGTSYFTI